MLALRDGNNEGADVFSAVADDAGNSGEMGNVEADPGTTAPPDSKKKVFVTYVKSLNVAASSDRSSLVTI